MMFSVRYQRPVVLTRHAELRMQNRSIPETLLLDVIDTGGSRFADANHLWAFKDYPDRSDNLICAVLVLEDRLVVKTVMNHFSLL